MWPTWHSMSSPRAEVARDSWAPAPAVVRDASTTVGASQLSLTAPGVHLVMASWNRWPHALPQLVTPEKERAARFRNEVARGEFIVGRATARALLGLVLHTDPRSVPIVSNCGRCGAAEHGKPRVAQDQAPHFSISHSAGRVVVALSTHGPVGVDIELVRPQPELTGVAELALCGDERRHLARLRHEDETEALHWFSTRWCLKEAITKRDGDGLARDPRTVLPEEHAVLDLSRTLPTGLAGAVAFEAGVPVICWWAAPAR